MPAFDPLTYRYASRRNVVYVKNAVACTSVPLGAQIGLDVMKSGGNAVDAAVAMAAAMPLLEPTGNGLGSDCFALVWIERDKRLYGLNASGVAPMALSAEKVRAMGYTEMPKAGWLPTMVPGAPAGWAELNRRFGTKPLAELFAPAISYAEEGYPVPVNVARQWERDSRRIAKAMAENAAPHEYWWKSFMKPDGTPYRAGELFRFPDYAATLRSLAATDCESYYRGALMERIVAFSRATGGYFCEDDFRNYRPEWVEPITQDYRGYTVCEIPPNGHGITVLMALGILNGMTMPENRESAEHYHKVMEAIKLAFADTRTYVADPRYMKTKVNELLDPAYLAARRALILYRGQSAGVPILLALCLLALCGAYLLVGGNLAVMQIEQEYDYELTVDSFGSWEYYDAAALRPRFTESDRADILSLPYVARVDGAQRVYCNLVLDEVTGYLRPDPALHTYLDEPTGSAWEIERREAYLTLKNELGIEGDLFGVEVTALPEERILACAGDVLHGEIDIEALNAGREVIVVAPDCVYERTQPVRGGLWISYATEPFAEREPEAQYREFANDTFQVGQELPLCQLFAREYKLGYNWDWNIRAGALARRDASPVIGATVDWATASDMGLLSGYDNGDVITTHAGLRALGLYSNGYSEFGVALSGTPNEETEAQIDAALREIASRVEGARYGSQFASLRAQREIIRNLLLAAGTVLCLALSGQLIGLFSSNAETIAIGCT